MDTRVWLAGNSIRIWRHLDARVGEEQQAESWGKRPMLFFLRGNINLVPWQLSFLGAWEQSNIVDEVTVIQS